MKFMTKIVKFTSFKNDKAYEDASLQLTKG